MVKPDVLLGTTLQFCYTRLVFFIGNLLGAIWKFKLQIIPALQIDFAFFHMETLQVETIHYCVLLCSLFQLTSFTVEISESQIKPIWKLKQENYSTTFQHAV